MWEQLTPRETEVCERLILNQRRVNNNDRYILERLYRRFAIPPNRHSEIVLAVALVYDRNPHLRIDDSLLRCEANYTNHSRPASATIDAWQPNFADFDSEFGKPIFYRIGNVFDIEQHK
jgi:hypothetical protein